MQSAYITQVERLTCWPPDSPSMPCRLGRWSTSASNTSMVMRLAQLRQQVICRHHAKGASLDLNLFLLLLHHSTALRRALRAFIFLQQHSPTSLCTIAAHRLRCQSAVSFVGSCAVDEALPTARTKAWQSCHMLTSMKYQTQIVYFRCHCWAGFLFR